MHTFPLAPISLYTLQLQLPMASASTSTAFDSPTKSSYDVFISHRGPDTKNNFASYLYRRLVLHGIRVFWDKEEMQVGDSLTSQIQDAIKTASVHVVIFSPGFAGSVWCLNELLQMVESKAPIIPVFFRVQPTELRQTHGEGVYAQALRTLQQKRTYDSQPRYSSIIIENWRTALSNCWRNERARAEEV